MLVNVVPTDDTNNTDFVVYGPMLCAEFTFESNYWEYLHRTLEG